MLKIKHIAALLLAALALSAAAAKTSQKMANATDKKDVLVDLTTSMGNIRLLLYGDTPKHLDNFVKLVNDGYYDGLLFHRVINDFMVQTGDPTSRNAPAGKMLGMGDPDYKIDAEFVYPKHFHKRGALAAAREEIPQTPPSRAAAASSISLPARPTPTLSSTRWTRAASCSRSRPFSTHSCRSTATLS